MTARRLFRVAVEDVRSIAYESSVDARRPGSCRHRHRKRELISSFNPDVVVVEFCCNHWPANQRPGHRYRNVASRTPQFYVAWTEAVDESVGILTSRGTTLAWVHTPPAQDPGLNSLIDELNEISSAAGQRHGLSRIDWASAVSNGTFQLNWQGQEVRDSDGLHLRPRALDEPRSPPSPV